MSAKNQEARARWDAMPPKKCPGCDRVLPRTQFYTAGGKCKRCYGAHKLVSRNAEPEDHGRPTGPDFMSRAQAELFPGRRYTELSREECGAVRRRALALLAASQPAQVEQQEVARAG